MKIARFSRIGFILAAAGSAVGLGNIWKFPYITGVNGGGAFVFVYLITVLMIGFSVMIAEMLIGYLGRRDSVSSFEELAPRHKERWKYGGFIAVTGLMIMVFYSVVIGWIFHYITVAAVHLPDSVAVAETLFTQMLHEDIWTQLFYHTLAFAVITYIIIRGIKQGIERLNLILMPTLFLIVGGMFLYALNLDGFAKAWAFMFEPEWHNLSSNALVIAVGHAFFTLSLGMASILTYSASLPKESNLVRSALAVVVLDTSIALLAGLMLFTFLFEYGAEPSAGPGLVFISMPAVFYEMGIIGNFFAIIFFIALAFAGLTSAVSIVEPMVQYLIDRFKMTRVAAALAMGLSFYLIGILALLSNTTAYGAVLTFGSRNLFDWMDFVTASILLPAGGLIMAFFVGHVIDKGRVDSVLKRQLGILYPLWYFNIRYVVPLALFVVMLNLMGVLEL